MRGKGQFAWFFLLFSFCSFLPTISHAEFQRVNARSAIVYDLASGKVLYEQNADELIPPASLTKIVTLYLTWEAIESGQISLSDRVRVSRYAASMPNVRMGLRAGDVVTVSELIHGMAIESGNDAAVAMAEYLGGTVPHFVAMMNTKARELGMTHTHFVTPNGLPAQGQLTTARDIMKASVAYIRRFPDALAISSLRSFTYKGKTDHNPNNLLGVCPGVDGLKTGFVCASGFNISATAMRDHTRIIAVVLGAQSPGVRRVDVESLIENAYREIGGPCYAVGAYRMCRAAHAGKTLRVGTVRRAPTRRSRPVALLRPTHGARMRALRARSVATPRNRMRALARGRRIAPTRLALSERKVQSRHEMKPRVVSKTAEHAARRRKLTKAALHRKTVHARALKASPKALRMREKKRKLAIHSRTRVKTAVKKRHSSARRAKIGHRNVA